MNRRVFTKILPAAVLGGTSLAPHSSFKRKKKRIKPKRLKKGDRIGLITPGSYIGDEGLEKAVNNLEGLGFKVQLAKNIRAERGYNAGTDQERLTDLHTMFTDKTIDAIWCARGGYGCGRLLPFINYRLIKKNPKILIGYSDITALLIAIYEKTGLVGFHGPVASSDFTEYSKTQLSNVLINPQAQITIPLSEENEKQGKTDTLFQSYIIKGGKASGQLVGGNLSLLASSAGTKFQPNIKGKLVFIEDVGEAPYRIDRMLTQLRQSYELQEAAGIILGIFNGCEMKPESRSLNLKETLINRFVDLNIPVFYGASFGHISDNATLPIGVKAQLDADAKKIVLLEQAVL